MTDNDDVSMTTLVWHLNVRSVLFSFLECHFFLCLIGCILNLAQLIWVTVLISMYSLMIPLQCCKTAK